VTLTFWNSTAFPSSKSALPGSIVIPLGGVGDDAVYTGFQNAGQSQAFKLFVKKSGTVFSITVFGFPDDQAKEKEKTLALNVLAKL
jgi:hypothetical protein